VAEFVQQQEADRMQQIIVVIVGDTHAERHCGGLVKRRTLAPAGPGVGAGVIERLQIEHDNQAKKFALRRHHDIGDGRRADAIGEIHAEKTILQARRDGRRQFRQRQPDAHQQRIIRQRPACPPAAGIYMRDVP
jgi:hypothetical protein